jgi:hypothetical protein
MSILNTLQENESRKDSQEARDLLASLIQPEQYVGDLYSIGYESASVQINDTFRQKVGGIPSLCFLVATRINPITETIDYKDEESSVILLRVMDSTPLPGHAEAERVRVEVAQKVSGETNIHWDESDVMDLYTNHLLSFAGIKCRVIGTFFVDESPRLKKLALRFGSDISNYYPNRGLKVYKPNGKALAKIVNYFEIDRLDPDKSQQRVVIGQVRYASTNRSFQGVSNVQVEVAPADLLGQKSALFGMTRTGKSNTTKIIVKSVFGLRFASDKPQRIGQIVFDPNGEYANENSQDGDQRNPNAVKNVWASFTGGSKSDVITYGILPHINDPDRHLMLLNFFEEGNLQNGKEIIDDMLSSDGTKFIQNFRQVRFEKPSEELGSPATRYKRRVLAYRALLVKAGFKVPENIRAFTTRLFNQKLLDAMSVSDDPSITAAAQTFKVSSPDWEKLALAFECLANFIHTDAYKAFEQVYVKEKEKKVNSNQEKNKTDAADNETEGGETWADDDLKKILEMYRYPNGSRQIGKARVQHTPDSKTDYAAEIYKDLESGKLVIVDQSSGDPEVNRSSAERIMWHIFHKQQEKFRSGVPILPEMLVYVEEAHNILPAGSDMDLQDVWVRTAKEGAKYHIGLVYATQEVSSIQKNILKNTANWFIGHLNNTDETKELCKYYDFEDFEASIRRAQDKGFLRVKTLSNLFVVPVQIDQFRV